MAFADEFTEALSELEDPEIFPAGTFTWNSTDYPCFHRAPVKGGTLEDFGYAVDLSITIIVRCNLFTDSRPVRGNEFILNSVTYRIHDVLTSQGDSFLRITGINPSKGA